MTKNKNLTKELKKNLYLFSSLVRFSFLTMSSNNNIDQKLVYNILFKYK